MRVLIDPNHAMHAMDLKKAGRCEGKFAPDDKDVSCKYKLEKGEISAPVAIGCYYAGRTY